MILRANALFSLVNDMNEEKIFKKNIKKEEKINRKKANYGWIFKITILAFIISILFSLLSELLMPKVNILIGFIIMFLFIFLGIIFDMVGVAVTAADITPMHSMSSKKIRGAKTAVSFKQNASKVSSFCNDVIGDICGIISGSAGVYIASKLASTFNINVIVFSLIITGIISALTIGGKAIFKSYALNNSTSILFNFSKFISLISFKK